MILCYDEKMINYDGTLKKIYVYKMQYKQNKKDSKSSDLYTLFNFTLDLNNKNILFRFTPEWSDICEKYQVDGEEIYEEIDIEEYIYQEVQVKTLIYYNYAKKQYETDKDIIDFFINEVKHISKLTIKIKRNNDTYYELIFSQDKDGQVIKCEIKESDSNSSDSFKPIQNQNNDKQSKAQNESPKTPEDNTGIKPPTPKQPSIASLQKIFFGPPGTGKSYKAKILKEILKEKDDELIIIRATFHPEYLNSDFIAKLVPVTNGEKVEYKVLPGHFVKAFAKALAAPEKHVLLIIEEINRGNCSAIFGEVFQLLDRDDNGESVYENEWSDLAKIAIKEEMEKVKKDSYDEEKIKKIPVNMSIVATMNTCDENIFFMDSAFKRRWGFEYVGIEYESSDDDHKKQLNAKIEDGSGNITWKDFLEKLNSFIKGSKAYRLEDKLVGQWFIKAKEDKISKDDIKNKLMHYLWDNVFSRDRKPLMDLLEDDKPGTVDLKTFGDFIEKYDVFIEKIMKIKIESK